MTSTLSMEAIVARLEEQIAYHREQEALHAKQAAHHGERQASHAAELAALTGSLEAFRSATARASELANREPVPRAAPVPEAVSGQALDIGRKPSLARMVQRVIEAHPAGEPFGTAHVTAEINRRYADRLRRPVKPKMVSIALRRMATASQLRTLRKGRPHHEALYARE